MVLRRYHFTKAATALSLLLVILSWKSQLVTELVTAGRQLFALQVFGDAFGELCEELALAHWLSQMYHLGPVARHATAKSDRWQEWFLRQELCCSDGPTVSFAQVMHATLLQVPNDEVACHGQQGKMSTRRCHMSTLHSLPQRLGPKLSHVQQAALSEWQGWGKGDDPMVAPEIFSVRQEESAV